MGREVNLDKAWEKADYLIFGHLAHQNLTNIGDKFLKGQIVAKTGISSENGGWFPHLHVQCVNQSLINQYQYDLRELDGYYLVEGKPYDIAPDPTYLVGENV